MTCAALTLALALGTACEYEVLSRSLEAERRAAWALVAPDQPYPGQAVRGQGAPAPAPAAPPAADRRVVDGDTVVIDGVRVRLAGIDAPERGQQHGRHDDAGALATTALAKTMTRYETRGWALSVETDGYTEASMGAGSACWSPSEEESAGTSTKRSWRAASPAPPTGSSTPAQSAERARHAGGCGPTANSTPPTTGSAVSHGARSTPYRALGFARTTSSVPASRSN